MTNFEMTENEETKIESENIKDKLNTLNGEHESKNEEKNTVNDNEDLDALNFFDTTDSENNDPTYIAKNERESDKLNTLNDVPFEEDKLCSECSAIFTRDITWGHYPPNMIRVDSKNPTWCRLCALFIHRFPSRNSGDLVVEYALRNRNGYFMAIHDIVFRPVGRASWEDGVIRMALQQDKRTDEGYPEMVHYETKLSKSTNSEESLNLAAKWMRNCMENHQSCNTAFPKSGFLPTRLVEIHASEDGTLWIKLVETKGSENSLVRECEDKTSRVLYATLSHCWGLVTPFTLNLGNHASCLKSIPLTEISKVFQDAIQFAYRSNLRYIWIDSLCIIQNSTADWEAESSQMGSIYGGGILNIAATGFPDGQNGLFSQRDCNVITPIRVVLPEDIHVRLNPEKEDGYRQREATKGNYILVDVHEWKDGVDESPLCKRGWVAQERALSIRTLHFGSQQLFWDCLCIGLSEVFPQGLASGAFVNNPKMFLSSREKEKEGRTKKLIEIRDREKEWRRMEEEHRLMMAKWRTEDSDDDSSLVSLIPEREPHRTKLEDLSISHRDFVGCDDTTLNILDGLGIEGWEEFKAKLVKWGFGKKKDRVKAVPIRGMTLEQQQWLTIVEVFSGCKLSYSKDKLVAISGMARMIAGDMNCAYLAGMWRRELEHQLLWKVEPAMKGTKKDGSRGPTWSWSSVDGPVSIREWSGYFYAGIPGDITWLSNVDDAQVQPSGNDGFGQIKSGHLTMTGRLGVFRINKDKADKPGSHSGNLVGTKRRVYSWWDTTEYEQTFGKSSYTELWRYTTYGKTKKSRAKVNLLDVFYLPVRVMDSDPDVSDYEQPMLTGLLLLPTWKTNGQFRRVGMFEISEHWERESVGKFTGKTDILDSRFFVRKGGNGDYTLSII